MSDVTPVIEMFQTRFRQEFPQFASSIGNAIPDSLGNRILLDVPCPASPDKCRLGVLYRGDCFEIWFSVVGTRGPAERQILINKDMIGSVSETIGFVRNLIKGGILIDIYRYRWFWFQPYYLAFFREALRRPRGRVQQTISWIDCKALFCAVSTVEIP